MRRPSAQRPAHRPWPRWLAVAVAVGVLATTPTAVAAQATNFCPPGQSPQFALGFAALKAQLGASMGNPVECEHPDPDGGGTVQHTTTGLAYYRTATNIAVFTNGWEHYALLNGLLSVWRNQDVNPPQPNADQTTYVDATVPLRARVDQLDQQLTMLYQLANAGGLDQLDYQQLGAILDELTNLRDQFAARPVPPALAAFAARWAAAQDADMAAAQALLGARLSTDPTEQASLLQAVGTQLQLRDQQREASTFAFSQVLPIAISPA
jgi:hypothetical protein